MLVCIRMFIFCYSDKRLMNIASVDKQPEHLRGRVSKWIREHVISYTFARDEFMPNPGIPSPRLCGRSSAATMMVLILCFQDFVFPKDQRAEDPEEHPNEGAAGRGQEEKAAQT